MDNIWGTRSDLTDNDRILIAQGVLSGHLQLQSKNIQDYEFKVFSQFGDDGIIQFLIKKAQIINKYFIEFGVEDYSESNTRFLLMNNNWSGFIMDGSRETVDKIIKQPYFWKYDLQAIQAFVTKKNINELIGQTGWQVGDIGLLSIDIDGNDYWVWEEIDRKSTRLNSSH